MQIMKTKVIAMLAVLMLASASPALASDQLPADMTPEQRWQLRADYQWWVFSEKHATTDPCQDAAFTDIYGGWYGCPPPTEAMLEECLTYFGGTACDNLMRKVRGG